MIVRSKLSCVELTTERLILRPWASEDAEGLYRLFGDAQVRCWLNLEGETSLEEMRTYLGVIQETYAGYGAPYQCWSVGVQETGEICGIGLLRPLKQDASRAEIGWGIESAHWGKGYATEALVRITDYALEHFTEVHAVIRHDNERSIRVAEKLGMAEIPHEYEFDHPYELLLYQVKRPL